MPVSARLAALLLIVLVLRPESVLGLAAQGDPAPVEAPAQANGRVRVYLDCPGGGFQDQCFSQYLRDTIQFVDFVRQPQDADVHVLSSSRGTGGGGQEVVLRFIGRGRFEGHDHDLRAVTMLGDTENTRRGVVLRTAIVGLLDYVAHDGIPAGVNLSVSTEARPDVEAPVEDPWNLWVFSTRVSGSIDADERSRELQSQLNFSADRVSEAWKIGIGGRVFESIERFELEEDDEDGDPFEVTREDRSVNGFVARSLGRHWSAGVRGRVASSTFSNNRLSVSGAPAIEFSVFPYDEYATRQLRLEYSAGFDRRRYHEMTIFEKFEETLWQHELSAVLDQRQPWGSLRAGFEVQQYLHDLSRYRIQGDGNVNLRLTRGLSLNFNGSASRVRNQLSLPLRDATDEEVLLRIRQLQSGYQVRVSFGVTYSFGSIFNNIINPRFGN
jgi:hypothetical protein